MDFHFLVMEKSWKISVEKEGALCREAWLPCPVLTVSLQWSKPRLEDPRWAWSEQVCGTWYFSLKCSDTVGWGDWKGIPVPPAKSWVSVCWWWRFEWSFVHLSSCSYHHHLHHPLLQ